jgi:hypothetical protein
MASILVYLLKMFLKLSYINSSSHVDVEKTKKLLLLHVTVFIIFLMHHYYLKVALLYLTLR